LKGSKTLREKRGIVTVQMQQTSQTAYRLGGEGMKWKIQMFWGKEVEEGIFFQKKNEIWKKRQLWLR